MKEELLKLRGRMAAVAAADTAYDGYNPARGALHGHCGAVAYVLQKMHGGILVGATVEGQRHIWNRFDSGLEVDLTSDQFGGDGYTPICKGRALKSRSAANERFLRFERRLLAS